MGERVIVRQNSDFVTEILAVDPHDPESDEFEIVEHVHQLTPYGMLLSSLASCTAIVLHTYAQHHGVSLQEVELRLEYDRVFADDCEGCEEIGGSRFATLFIEGYKEQIEEEIVLTGELTPEERGRLYMVSRHCPIHKMLMHGIEIQSHPAQET